MKHTAPSRPLMPAHKVSTRRSYRRGSYRHGSYRHGSYRRGSYRRSTTGRILRLVLILALLMVSIPSPSGALGAGAAGRPAIDPQDPHRLVIDGQPWYPSGYYPNIAALTADQTDYTNYYRLLVDALAVNQINLLRNVFNMGQPFGSAMTLYQRTGPGTAVDGKPKFDLTRFNPDFFAYWRRVIEYAGTHGIVVQLVITDSWHNKASVVSTSSSGNVWGMKYDYYNGTNNINGLNAAGNTDWHSTGHASYAYHQAVIRKVVDELGDLPNLIYEISNENYTNATWERNLADYLTQYEASKGRPRHLVMPRDLPNHDNAGAKGVDPVRAHNELVSNWGKNRPLIADNDGGGDADPVTRRKKAWAALTAGAHMSYFHGGMAKVGVLTSQDALDGMRYVGMVQEFLNGLDVDLRGMRPSDSLVSNGWALAEPGRRTIVYLMNGGSTRLSEMPPMYTAHWFNPRDGSIRPASGGPSFTAPDGKDWVLYVKEELGASLPAPSATPVQPQPTSTPTRTSPAATAAPTSTRPAPTATPGGTVNVKVNFQPPSAAVPSGYLADGGQAFGDRGNGYSYGWNTDRRAGARDRNASISPNQAYDTFNHLQDGGNFTWEMAVPSGSYEVRIAAGDASYWDSVFKIGVEGSLVVSGTPSKSQRWLEGSAVVAVNDGRLTVSSLSGASNNKINWIEIRPSTAGTAPVAPTQAAPTQTAPAVTPTPAPTSAASRVELKVNFQPGGASVPSGFLADGGQAFGDRGNGYTYGWNADNREGARDRNLQVSPNQAYDTFNHLQDGGNFTWEIALPDGAYQVRVVSGDPMYTDSVFKTNVEEVLVVNGTPAKGSYWVEGAATVSVTDGRLTVSSASGAENNKIAFIEIRSQ